MGTEYQEDQKECYKKMMEEIAGHPDFGKRNPVDIGIDCGYTEEKVMEMIQFLQDFKERPETGDRNGDDREKYYFLLENDSREHYIASVNINTWETEWVKDVKTMPYCFRIKGAIYAYAVKTAQENILEWENLETGDKGKFQTGENIEDMLIVDNGIAILTERFFVLYPYQGRKIQSDYPQKADTNIQKLLVEGKNAIYALFVYKYFGSLIWKIEKESFLESVIWESDKKIAGAQYKDEDLIWYVRDPRFSGYLKHSEKSLPNNKGWYSMPSHLCYNFIVGIVSTKWCELWQSQIFREGRWVCEFNGMLQKCNRATDGQVIGIYEKDIFVGVREGGRDLIKINLRDEDKYFPEPDILPVHKT